MNNKRYTKLILMSLIVMLTVTCSFPVSAEEEINIDAPIYLLGEPTSGKILNSEQIDKEIYPASITKIMTLLVAMEALEADEVDLDDEVVVPRDAEGIKGTTVFLTQGDKLLLEDLFKSVAVGSANDATIALAKHIAGDVDNFIDHMNSRAEELGMDNTNFVNTHGLHHDDHVSNARDIFTMSRELVRYEQVHDWFQIWYDDNFLVDREISKDDGVFLSNTNQLINTYPDCDGLKTGYTDEAGYGISATASRDSERYIAILLETEDADTRFHEAERLLDFGFKNYEVDKLFDKEETVDQLYIPKGNPDTVELRPETDVVQVFPRKEQPDSAIEVKIYDHVAPPIEQGEHVGELQIIQDSEKEKVNLITNQDVEIASIGNIFLRTIRSWASFGR